MCAIAFLWFAWPTPYEYTRRYPNVIRVNRFTGVTQHATADGWKTDRQLVDDSKAEATAAKASADARRAEVTSALQKLQLRDGTEAPIHIVNCYNPTEWSFTLDMLEMRVDYYAFDRDNEQRICTTNNASVQTIRSMLDNEIRVVDAASPTLIPPEVEAVPQEYAIKQVIHWLIESATIGGQTFEFSPPIEHKIVRRFSRIDGHLSHNPYLDLAAEAQKN